ncbi:MAG: transglutaminase family protein, partial [Pseudomonadota bacterium]|nr:transglutaminase family protein [Pseudomonadota bacterium]
ADPYTRDGGTWQLVDATGMADPAETIKIGVGRDAADVSFLTSFGANDFRSSSVRVTKE